MSKEYSKKIIVLNISKAMNVVIKWLPKIKKNFFHARIAMPSAAATTTAESTAKWACWDWDTIASNPWWALKTTVVNRTFSQKLFSQVVSLRKNLIMASSTINMPEKLARHYKRTKMINPTEHNNFSQKLHPTTLIIYPP